MHPQVNLKKKNRQRTHLVFFRCWELHLNGKKRWHWMWERDCVSSLIRVGPFPAIQSAVNVTKHLECVPACELHLYKAVKKSSFFCSNNLHIYTFNISFVFPCLFCRSFGSSLIFSFCAHCRANFCLNTVKDLYTHAHFLHFWCECAFKWMCICVYLVCSGL